jgi:hypothetical protein
MAEAMDKEQFFRERENLQLLCSGALSTEARMALCQKWKPEQFLDTTHRVLFEEIAKLGAVTARQLQELLPARVTNRGFRDVEIEEYFSA